MGVYLKVAAVALCALVIAMAASRFVQPLSAEALREYEQRYQELSARPSITAAEKQQLEALFMKINSAENIKAELIDFALKYSLLFLVVIPLAVYAAKRLSLKETPLFIASGLIFMAFILSGLVVPGAIIGAIFFMASVICKAEPRENRAGE